MRPLPTSYSLRLQTTMAKKWFCHAHMGVSWKMLLCCPRFSLILKTGRGSRNKWDHMCVRILPPPTPHKSNDAYMEEGGPEHQKRTDLSTYLSGCRCTSTDRKTENKWIPRCTFPCGWTHGTVRLHGETGSQILAFVKSRRTLIKHNFEFPPTEFLLFGCLIRLNWIP